MFDEELRGLNQHWRRRTNSDYRPAVLGTAFGVIADPDHPGYVFIREQTSNGLSAPRSVLLPSNVPIRLVSGTKVKLGFDEQDREIILGGDTSGTLASGLSTVSELQRAQSPRNNQVSIETLSVVPTSPASLSVFVKAWSVIVADTYSEFSGINSGDLTLPSSGDMYYAVLFVENDYATLDIEYSTARGVADFPPLGDDDIQECLDASPANSTPVWAIPLNGDMTAIQLSDIMAGRDLRQMINSTDSSSFAPSDATYITQTPNSALTNEQALSLLSTGYMKVTTATGVVSSQVVPIPVTDGGTGQTSLTAHDILIGNGTSGITVLAPSTARNVAISDGTDWTSRALVDADIPNSLTLDNGSTITIKDANFTIQDDGDTSKQAQFQASSISVSTTRTYTLPNANGTLALTSDLDSYVILAPTVSSRNVIQPTADAAIGLVVKRHSSTTSGANLQEWQDESGNEIARIGTTGNILSEGGTVIARKDGGTASFDVRCYGTTFSPYIIGRQANGTLASPTASVNGDNLMVFGGRGFPNISYDSGVLSFKATETHSASAGGAKLSVLVTPNTTLTQRTALEIQNTGKINLIAGTQSTRFAAAGGALFEDFADAGNTTTSETDAYSHTITGATLAVDGDKIEVEYGGTYNTGASKTARVRGYFGGTAYADTTALTVSSAYDTWHLQATLIRVDSTTVRVIGTFSLHHSTLTSSLSWSFYSNLTSITLSSDQTIKITLQAGGASAATNDILAKVGVVDWLSNGG